MCRLLALLSVCFSFSFIMVLPRAHAADRVDLLLELLQKKGVISAEEANALSREVSEAAEAEDPAATPAQAESGEPSAGQQAEAEALAAPVEVKTNLELGSDGLWARTSDGKFALGLGGFLIGDWRYFGSGTPQHDFFDIRRARLSAEGWVYRDFHFEVEGEFGDSGGASLRDGYLEWAHFPWARIRGGQYKQPFSTEYLTPLRYLPFAERSFVGSLVPGRDVGIMVHGALKDEAVVYGLSYANGMGLDPGLDSNDGKDIMVRVVLRPFYWSAHHLLEPLRFGGGYTFGRIEPLDLRNFEIVTSGLTPIFRLSSGGKFGMITEADSRSRAGAEISWHLGSFLLQGEYAEVGFEGLKGTVGDPFDGAIRAWYVSGVFFLTGEHPHIEGGVLQRVRPRANFSLSEGTWGAFSLGVRYDAFDADRDLFNVVDEVAYTGGAYALGGVLNWYLNPSVRLAVNFVHTEFDDPMAIGYSFTGQTFQDSENVLISRFQLDF